MSSAHDEDSEHSQDDLGSPTLNAKTVVGTPVDDSLGVNEPPAASLLASICNSTHPISNVSAASSDTSVMRLSRTEALARTVHLRCLPPFLKQKALADVFEDCGEYLRVRICGNATTHQKWVYGFVEFATKDAAMKMMTYCGMELPNGPDKPPLRFKCSPSKQPILDCMAYDADVVKGTPCGFGRGYLAECTLNDVLLLVGGGGGNTKPITAGGASSSGKGCCGGGVGDRRMKAANNVLTALTVQSIRKVAANGCGCGCSGVNCCGCCNCWKGLPESTESTTFGGGEIPSGGSAKGTTQAVAATVPACGQAAYANGDGGSERETYQSDCCVSPAGKLPQLTATFSTFKDLPLSLMLPGGGAPRDIMQQLATAFQGLRESTATREHQLDGPSIVQRAEVMMLAALHRAFHVSSDTCSQDILPELTQVLAFLDSNAAVTGGAAQTASGDSAATLAQRVTQLRMLANLVGVLLNLLRRRVGDALPLAEAVLVIFAQIPPSTLLLRTRPRGKAGAVQEQHHAEKVKHARVLGASHGGRGPSAVEGATAELYAPAVYSLIKRRSLSFPQLGVFVDGDVTGPLLEMVDDDNAYDGIHHIGNHDDPLEEDDIENRDDGTALLKERKRSTSSCIYTREAFPDFADSTDLRLRDELFWRYVLHVLVSVGLAMEEVHPGIARSVYTLANGRAMEVFGESSEVLAAQLATAPTSNPRLCAALFADAYKPDSGSDITFFPHQFFEGVNVVLQRLRDTRGTEDFWRLLPPNHIVTLFNT